MEQICEDQTRIIVLNEGEHLESTLYTLKKGWTLEFQLGPTQFGKSIRLYTNHPLSPDVEFERSRFYELEWLEKETNSKNGYSASCGSYAHLTIIMCGSFKYYFTHETGESKHVGSGYFTVQPTLSVGFDNEKIIHLNSIQCQTILTKCLGHFEEWEPRLRVSKESGYNMLHFTPVQELGGSGSAYCIKNQLKLNPRFNTKDFAPTFDDLRKLTKKLQDEWEILSVTDVVLNHTANESPWLLENVEFTYNMITAPYLIPAAILEGCLCVFSKEVANGKLMDRGIPREIHTEEHIQAIKNYLECELIPNLHLEEFYTCNIDKVVDEFKKSAGKIHVEFQCTKLDELRLINRSFSGRNQATIDMDLALKIFCRDRAKVGSEDLSMSIFVDKLKKTLRKLNSEAEDCIRSHLHAAVNNCLENIRYHRVQAGGPELREVSEINPLVPRYFTGEFSEYEYVEKDVMENGRYIMAHNGWVMNHDPLKNFAAADSYVYLRRELIPWGDSVKLRYGDCYDDCPALWDHMRKYVEITANIFHGIRLDNCHSTPLPVAEYLIDCARRVRPDLYIIAELFTNSDATDNIYVNRLGISSLIREAMSACNPRELGRLLYRYGGDPVGSFWTTPRHQLTPAIAHALFFDVTHDNRSPIEEKTVFDSLASSSLVAMACCASGSSRGFDEFVPHHIHVVNEERLYKSWTNGEIVQSDQVNCDVGMLRAKNRLNLLHKTLNDEGYSQIFVDQMDENVIAVTRHNPVTHENVILVAYTAFSNSVIDGSRCTPFLQLEFEGECSRILFEAQIVYRGEGEPFLKPNDFKADKDHINGLSDYKVEIKEDINIHESTMVECIPCPNGAFSRYQLKNFLPGSITAFKVSPKPDAKPKLESMINLTTALLEGRFGRIIEIIRKMTLTDLNFALYRCSEEGIEDGIGPYHVPGHGSLVYCGLQGFLSVLDVIRSNNDLGHPFCDNLRSGPWALDYISGRLKGDENSRNLGLWFEEVFEILRDIPTYLIPKYFDVIVSSVTKLLLSAAAFQMSDFIRNGSTFARALAMGSVQCVGIVKSALLPMLSPNLKLMDNEITMSAGLPHFSTSFMRSWGRDTFISLRGLFLITGRFELARSHILAYGGCLRHGLIPNLLNGGVNARYNCRDAIWWWLYSILSYINFVPDGYAILEDPVSRIFPTDDSQPVPAGVVDQSLASVMQEALSVHFQGLCYRERSAGHSLDENMSSDGFNNSIGVDLKTGFVYGGNEYNCGTWMDKMGSSQLAGNLGVPATPRDGSAVEIIGLSKAVLRQMTELYNKGWYPFDRVKRRDEKGNITEWTFKEWDKKIMAHFEDSFWVGDRSDREGEECKYVHRRGIYKDCVGASHPWTDYQLRCNFLIALTVAPELANPEHARRAIKTAEEILLGPLGIRTLDPNDWKYNGDYHNGNNTSDPNVAHGFNYHQGPEWVWPVGYFLRAKLHFAKSLGRRELRQAARETRQYLAAHYTALLTSPWRGLPELTNTNGSWCPGSCHVQAWSMASLLEVLYELEQLEL